MRRPPPLAATRTLVTLVVLAAACARSPSPDERPRLAGAARGWNVLLLSVDTLRADRLGAYGYRRHATSPRFDALLARGVRFERAMAPRASTWPSLATVLTGLYPSGHGVVENGYALPDELPTLPLQLRQAGYRTGAFLSNMCKANHQGWDSFACAGGADGRANREALAWTATLDGGRPFFLWVHYMGAHPPYYNGGDLAARVLDPGYAGPLAPRRHVLDRVMLERQPLGERDLAHLDAIYDAAVMGTDRRAGELLDGLAAQGRLERTLIVFLADHGEELYQHHGYLYHACSVYQTTLHVPLALVAPGLLAEGAAVPQTVELVDLAPTVYALLGLPTPAEPHGVPLVGYLERPGEGGAGKPAYSEYGTSRVHTVLAGRFKLIDNPDGLSPVCLEDAPPDFYPIRRTELYDLEADPGETRDLAAGHPARVAELQQLIRRRFADLGRRDGPQEIPEELKRELRALGYIAN